MSHVSAGQFAGFGVVNGAGGHSAAWTSSGSISTIFNRAYRQHLGLRQPVELARWWDLRTALQETDHLYQVWDNVRDARCEYYYVTVRRQALKKLREMIGENAYYQGQMPPQRLRSPGCFGFGFPKTPGRPWPSRSQGVAPFRAGPGG